MSVGKKLMLLSARVVVVLILARVGTKWPQDVLPLIALAFVLGKVDEFMFPNPNGCGGSRGRTDSNRAA